MLVMIVRSASIKGIGWYLAELKFDSVMDDERIIWAYFPFLAIGVISVLLSNQMICQ